MSTARATPSIRGQRGVHLAILAWALLMAPLLTWGLPDSSRDELLFGGDTPWPAERYRAADDIAALRANAGGADTDLNPLATRDELIDLTPDEAARAEILRRYRLYSRQPDEMIIFRALQRMQPRALDLDPRLYQYGGGYLYLVAAALATAAVAGLVELSNGAATYLNTPEAFARFYLVARLVSLAFGALTLLAVFKLARRAGGRIAGWIALLAVAGSPVFITAVAEAKPHLPSAGMILWATLSALDYAARGRRRDALRMGLQGGYAFGLVLTGLAAAALWPLILVVRARPRVLRDLLLAGLVAAGVYVITNPYVLYNYLFRPEILSGNLGNSTAMYANQLARAADGARRVAVLLIESIGPGMLGAGVLGLLLLARRRPTWIAAAPGIAMLLLCIALGAGKPAEFARFLILPCLLLGVAGGVAIVELLRRQQLAGSFALVVVFATLGTPAYVRALALDAFSENESRRAAARFLRDTAPVNDTIGVVQEPAPYAVPPLDFTRRDIVLLPPVPPSSNAPLPAWLVFTADDDTRHADAWWQAEYERVRRIPATGSTLSPITWAHKPVYVYRRVAKHSPAADQ